MKTKGRRDLRRSHSHSNSFFKDKEKRFLQEGEERFKDERRSRCILYRARSLDYKYVQKL